MKLRLLQSMAGIDFSHNVGDVIEVNDADAIQRYVERGIAEIVEPAKKEKAINAWLKQYNHIRPHQSLNMRPPVPETLLKNGT